MSRTGHKPVTLVQYSNKHLSLAWKTPVPQSPRMRHSGCGTFAFHASNRWLLVKAWRRLDPSYTRLRDCGVIVLSLEGKRWDKYVITRSFTSNCTNQTSLSSHFVKLSHNPLNQNKCIGILWRVVKKKKERVEKRGKKNFIETIDLQLQNCILSKRTNPPPHRTWHATPEINTQTPWSILNRQQKRR